MIIWKKLNLQIIIIQTIFLKMRDLSGIGILENNSENHNVTSQYRICRLRLILRIGFFQQ